MAHPPGTGPAAGYSSTGGLRGAHARLLRRQPAGYSSTGKNARIKITDLFQCHGLEQYSGQVILAPIIVQVVNPYEGY